MKQAMMANVEEEDAINEELYRDEVLPHMADLTRLAAHMTGDVHDGNDLVQETLLSAYRSFHTYRQGTNCRAWLMTIMRNQFIDQIRRVKRQGYPVILRPEDVGRMAALFERAGSIADPETTVSSRLVMDSLRKLIRKLPAEFRKVFVLRFLKHFSYQEIARTMECPLGTVRSRVYRVRAMVKAMVREDSAIPSLAYD